MSLPFSTLLANRFEIDRLVGSGGMAHVYRARDHHADRWVALKLPHLVADGSLPWERFEREAQILAALQHPGIVAYIAHGRTPTGQRYLAMEWLEGETLATRLASRGLSLQESLTCIRATASALQLAHSYGIIHRDIKPSNLFLRECRVERTTVLDFGIARLTDDPELLTVAGSAIGTPGYMAPEQARGEREIGPSADLFSLGCVLFECLTGHPPFIAEHPVAVLAKILYQDAPGLRTFRPELSQSLDRLLGRLLTKDPAQRLPNATALLSALAELAGDSLAPVAAAPSSHSRGRSNRDVEQRLICVLILEPEVREAAELPTADFGQPQDLPQPIRGKLSLAPEQEVQALLATYGGQGQWLMSGELVATFGNGQDATDQVAQAAQCALALARLLPAARLVLATGRGRTDTGLPVGDAIDRAASLLRSLPSTRDGSTDGDLEPTRLIRIDELSARLLERRFALDLGRQGSFLLGEQLVDQARRLLGQPTSCVGRESELGILEAQWKTSVGESEARAVVVAASPGMGKSRLRHEFLRRLRDRGDAGTVLEGRAEPGTTGSSYALLGRVVRKACAISAVETLAERQAKVLARVRKKDPSAAAERTAAFLGELCGTPFSDDHDRALRVARQSPDSMREQLQRSFIAFLRAECATEPLLLVLDDLQWADSPSVLALDQTLSELADAPLLIVALARPELHELFPNLWHNRPCQRLELRPLNRKACERLIHQVLRIGVTPAVVESLFVQSGGNALFLEELLRAVAEGVEPAKAETIIAMLQARIGRLGAGARRSLRAASLLGSTFWKGGVLAILGEVNEPLAAESGLAELLGTELIERHAESCYPGEAEYGFRHATIREAALGLLVPEDVPLGHRRAGAYLRSVGESNPLTLAEHLERGGALSEALGLYTEAAEQALRRGDAAGACSLSQSAQRCGAQGEALGHIFTLQAEAAQSIHDFATASLRGQEALPHLRVSSRLWYRAVYVAHHTAAGQDPTRVLSKWADLLLQASPEPDAVDTAAEAASACISYLCTAGEFALARKLYAHKDGHLGETDGTRRNPMLMIAESQYLRAVEPDPWRQLELLQSVSPVVQELGSAFSSPILMDFVGEAQGELGDLAGGEATLRTALERARKVNQEYYILHAALHLAALLGSSPDRKQWEESAELARAALRADKLSLGYREWCHSLVARALLRLGEAAPAEAEARQATELAETAQLRRLAVLATRIEALIALGRGAEADEQARRALARIDELGSAGYVEIQLRLAAAEAFLFVKNSAAAEHQLVLANRELARRAQKIPDAAVRARYLSELPENARVRALLSEFQPGGAPRE